MVVSHEYQVAPWKKSKNSEGQRTASVAIAAQIRSNERVRVIALGHALVLGILLVLGLVLLVLNIRPLQLMNP